VEHTQDFDGLSAHAVGPDVAGLGHYQLARAGKAAWAPHGWLLNQQGDGLKNPLNDQTRSTFVVDGNVGGLFVKIAQGLAQPLNLRLPDLEPIRALN
jgi:hypothetical protein